MEKTQGLSRRGFFGASFAVAAGAAATAMLGGCAPKGGAGENLSWNEEVDVVVVGAGAGGYAAAIEAAENGASVIVLEKAEKIGGDSALCDGILGGWGTRLQKDAGIELTADEVFEWFTANPEWYGAFDMDVARLNADKCGETIDWLQDIGVEFDPEVGPRFGYTELPAIHQVVGKGAAMMQVLAETAEAAGVTTYTGAPAVGLEADGTGRIIGVRAEKGGDAFNVKANKGVIIATGGFAGSSEVLTAFNSESAGLMARSDPNMTGDGLLMAMEHGAHICKADRLPLVSSLAGLETKSPVNLNYAFRLHEIWLDADGKRFFDESTPFESPLGHNAILRKQNAQGGAQPVAFVGTTPELSALSEKMPMQWPTANTVEEAAELAGLDPVAVKATVDAYNAACAAGRDDECGRPAEFLVPLEPPFYVAPITSMTTLSLGGLKIDVDARVQRMKSPADKGAVHQPIAGLYAAGETCEWNCAAGWTVLTAMTTGRIAGRNAASEQVGE